MSMIAVNRVAPLFFSLFFCLFIAACTGGKPMVKLGVTNSELAACPTSPNCVSSDAADPEHYIAPLQLSGSPEEAWAIVHSLVAALPRTRIITTDSTYLHAECRSTIFGFVDDLEIHLRPGENLMAVRSAARLGYTDFGVNRKRVERLRAGLLKAGMLK
jgi:uncharacterized protein (DUF1499 family)